MTAEAILHASKEAIQDRSSTRDHDGQKSMRRTVDFFNILADTSLTEREGWLFMACVKLCRSQQGSFHVDDYTDAASYVALAGECAASEVRPTRRDFGEMGEDLSKEDADGRLRASADAFNKLFGELDLPELQKEETKKDEG